MGLDPINVSGEVALVLKGSPVGGISSVPFIGANVICKEASQELSVRATGGMIYSAIIYGFRYYYVCNANQDARMGAFCTLLVYHFY